jgi:hypothetical protein
MMNRANRTTIRCILLLLCVIRVARSKQVYIEWLEATVLSYLPT